ncbi:DUF1127 domain-containing protein [Shimia abyssi]|uniref:Uncharacterized protein YjiS (DUF1127 family) n=1 Tax=Shimia abyssi TaxID=1662395 RepID=A0A2P8FKX1_9RHOB|nr:DUF1127 domain-containing protein [Shimia abyssi]PSL22352.1 uncharacterized protein YjiS (DUF1127 family) [Shimia abyssi]
MTLFSTFTRIFPATHGASAIGLSAIAKFAAVSRQRRALAKLDDAALLDMGLTRADVNAELKRPVWDVPSNWRG